MWIRAKFSLGALTRALMQKTTKNGRCDRRPVRQPHEQGTEIEPRLTCKSSHHQADISINPGVKPTATAPVRLLPINQSLPFVFCLCVREWDTSCAGFLGRGFAGHFYHSPQAAR